MEQRELQSLLRPEAYPDVTHTVQLKQTHISYIFLTDRFVYKVKKPVDFGFLNFTTIDRRRFYCHEEVRLNRRLSPDVYLGVVELRSAEDGLAFTGSGAVIDYAVKMVRLPEEQMLDSLLGANKLNEAAIRRVARTVAAFHLKAEAAPEIDQYGTSETIARTWEENFSLASDFIGETLTMNDFSFMRQGVEGFMAANAALFDERIARGFIRDCDGDLHMENICLGEEVWIFDCIEFNARFRYIDTASDIAFLLMDLEYHFRPDLSAAFLDEYCAVSGDDGCRPLLDFYKIYRAFVRGKVASLQLRDPDIPAEAHAAARQRALGYFRLARGYLLRNSLPPTLILVSGLMGSGKSTVAMLLGRELGVQVMSSDRVRKELYRVADSRSHDSFGAGLYSAEADARTYDELLVRGLGRLALGESVVVDATFRRIADRRRFQEAAAAGGYGFFLAKTDCPDELIRQRLAKRDESGSGISDGRLELFDYHLASYESPEASGEEFLPVPTAGDVWTSVDTILGSLGVLP